MLVRTTIPDYVTVHIGHHCRDHVVVPRPIAGAHGRKLCDCPVCQSRGEPGSRKLRERYEADFRSE